jgi:thioredoxin-dependent peroxiredoxin
MNTMPLPAIGSPAPDFSLPTDRGNPFQLAAHRGRFVVLFFYAEDGTEGCTVENIEFSALYHEFRDAGAEVLGISPDAVEKHCKFRDKHNLTVPLGSDTDRAVIDAFGLWQLKKMYGVEFMGVRRASFVIDPQGKVAAFILAPRIKGHAQKVLDTLRNLPRS